MQEDFHYYATYCAATIAGFDPEESETIAYSANFVDLCSRPFLGRIHAPLAAATTQLSMEMADARTDMTGIQDITRIWSSFHFLPQDLNADVKKGSRKYKEKYRLICGPNGDLVVDTVNLAKGGTLQAIGISMHVLADTWAHRYFAGTPSLVINNTNQHFFEMLPADEQKEAVTPDLTGKYYAASGQELIPKRIKFRHALGKPDDLDSGLYTNSMFQSSEKAIMNLGHGRAGHLPDYSFIRYMYLPAWGDYETILKDNPSDYYHAFCQMLEALKYLHGERASFKKDTYDFEGAAPYEEEIRKIIGKRQLLACEEWKALGVRLSGKAPQDISLERFQDEYTEAAEEKKDETFLGKFILGALAQKSLITNKIYQSGNRLAGISVDYAENGMKGIEDYHRLVKSRKGERK